MKPTHAVYVSALPRSLRDILIAHCWFANDDGSNIWPSVRTIAWMVGVDEKTVRHARRVLEYLGVLVAEADGAKGRGKTVYYRLNYEALAAVRPGQELPRFYKKAGNQRPPFGGERRQPAPAFNSTEKAGAELQKAGRRTPESRALDAERRALDSKRRERAPADPLDPLDPTGSRTEQTGAEAPELTTRGETETAADAAAAIPFSVYAAIATRALDESLREDRDESLGNVAERFKRLCADQRKPYDGEITRRAVAAAVTARDKARDQFTAQYRGVVQRMRGA
jgi:hypothetical protein